MAGVDKVIKHYRINHDTGERTLNTDINIFIILNAIAYIVNLVFIFTVGAFGGISSTTSLLSYNYQTPVTIDEVFFKIAWGIIIPYQGFWAVWQIANPSQRNCEGVVRAAYFYPLATALYAGYTISCRYGMMILGCVFVYGLCATLVGLAMSLQRYRAKELKGYLLWQAPLTIHAAWIMVETMLMTNVAFIRLDEISIIKLIIAAVSLLVIFITAISWLSSYPVDLAVPFVLGCAVGGMYLEMKSTSHYRNLINQDYGNTILEGWRYAVLAVFVLILITFIIKCIVVLLYQRPKDQEDRRKKKESRVSVSITIDTGANDKNKNNSKKQYKKKPKDDKRWDRRPKHDEYADDYNHAGRDVENYHSPPSTPVKKPKKKSSQRSKNKNNFRDIDASDPSVLSAPSPTPRKKRSTKKKKKPASSSGADTSSTSIDNYDDMA